jgi:P27 family predicted phage terminase small subunit
VKTRPPVAPKHLTLAARRLWVEIWNSAEMDPPAVLLLTTMCEAFDRLKQAQAAILEDGLFLTEKTAAGNEHRRAHPATAVERDARAAIVRCWKAMGFDMAPPGEL